MTEWMENKLVDLRAAQDAEVHMLCPRCGQDTMKAKLHTNALSRHVSGIYICDDCGTAEALLDMMGRPLPAAQWAWFHPQPKPSGFQSMTAADVLARVIADHAETVGYYFLRCLAEPESADEYRAEAFESCPGLTDLCIQPFTANFSAKDGTVLLRYRMTSDGTTEYTADIVRQ